MKCDELKPLMCAHEPNVRPMYDKFAVDAAIAELKAKLEDVQASMYADVVDANMENRRALWLAREWRAWCEGQFWLAIPSDRPRDIYHLFMTNRIHRTPAEWMAYWHKVEQLCNKKAEEYK